MNKQYVKGGQIRSYLYNVHGYVGFTVQWQSRRQYLWFKEQGEKRMRMVFWGYHMTFAKVPKRHTHSLGETIIYYLLIAF